MLSAADNELLTRTGPGTPMGDLFRRFWTPVLLSCELPEPDGPPVRVKVMGEDLIAFRDSSGRVGLTEPTCPHRGANLFFGRNEAGGIRCAFHGWKFDADGNCVDMPSVPNSEAMCKKIKLKTYPTHEYGDFVWAYMGPADPPPPMPAFEFGLMPPGRRFVSKKLQQCNWAQACEGGLDTAHFSFLHMTVGEQTDEELIRALNKASLEQDRARWMKNDGIPTFSTIAHAAGIVIGGARKADGNDLYWRISQFLLPNHGLAPNAFPGEHYNGQTWVPIDDHSCWIYCYTWNPDRDLTEAERAKFRSSFSVHSQVDENWVPIRRRENDYLIDREQQKKFTYTGITGVSEQDACIQDSQGLIADRTKEHLGPTDVGIVQFRRLMLKAAKDLAGGKGLPAGCLEPEHYMVRGGGTIADKSRSLEEVMLTRFGDRNGHAGKTGEAAMNLAPAQVS